MTITPDDIHSLARDNELVADVARAISALKPDNVYLAFFKQLAKNRGRNSDNPKDLALTIAEHGDKHPINFEIPQNPGEIPIARLQQYLLAFDEKEMNALGVAGGIRQPISRRTFGRTVAIIAGALAAGGSAGYMLAKKEDKPAGMQSTTDQQQPSTPEATGGTPDPSLLLLVGTAMAATALLQSARKRRRENPTVDYAMQHLPETLTDILVEQDKQIKAVLAGRAARGGASR